MQREPGPILQCSIILVGMMGAGKTALGHELARRLGVAFADFDDEIERAAAMTIPEIFARDGEPFFRRRELEVIARLLTGEPKIIATGGGAWMQPQNRDLIEEQGFAVWIDSDLETLWQRVRGRSTRPLLMTADPKGTLADLLKRRNPVYALADLRLATDGGDTVESAVRRLIAALKEEGILQ